jgi:diguanylate cyclase (GGDEF)-like protein
MHSLSRVLGRHERSARRERTLRAASTALVAAANAEDVYAAAVQAAMRLVEGDEASLRVAVALGTPERMTVVAARGPNSPAEGSVIFASEMPTAARRLLEGREARALDAADSAALRRRLGLEPEAAVSVVPLVGSRGVRGLISLSSSRPLAHPEEARGALTLLGVQVGLALEGIWLREQLAHQATHDGLTGLANRGLFRDHVEHALDRARAEGSRLAVLFLDLDNFKAINDGLGHETGDRVLQAVAERLKTTVAEVASDKHPSVARLGGDEFAVLLEAVPDAQVAHAIADRLIEAVHAPVPTFGKHLVPLASLGIVLADGFEEIGALMRGADLAMYRAKGEGGGRTARFEPTEDVRAAA